MNAKFYAAPEVEVVEVLVEAGFAATDALYGDDLTPPYKAKEEE